MSARASAAVDLVDPGLQSEVRWWGHVPGSWGPDYGLTYRAPARTVNARHEEHENNVKRLDHDA